MSYRFARRVVVLRASWTILIAALAACSAEDTTSPPAAPRSSAPSASTASTDSTPERWRLSNRFAYALADRPTTGIYRPDPRYAYNAFGGGIAIARLAAGAYEVRLDSADWGGALNISVTAHGSSAVRCSPGGYSLLPSFPRIRVACYDTRTLAATDSRFTFLVVGRNALTPRSAFAYADQPNAALYTPNPLLSYSSSLDSMWIKHSPEVGSYTVHLGTGSPGGSTFLVNAIAGNKNLCKIGPWHSYNVQTNCFDSAGNPQDARYYVLQVERGRPGRRLGFAWADEPLATIGVPYTPNGGYSYNSAGGSVSVVRNAPGQYVVTFDGLVKLTGHTENVQVSPFGGYPITCKVVDWFNYGSGLRVRVECRKLGGGFADSRFNVMVIE
jgi:hypothetical protein